MLFSDTPDLTYLPSLWGHRSLFPLCIQERTLPTAHPPPHALRPSCLEEPSFQKLDGLANHWTWGLELNLEVILLMGNWGPARDGK